MERDENRSGDHRRVVDMAVVEIAPLKVQVGDEQAASSVQLVG